MRAAVLTAADRPLEIVDDVEIGAPRADEVLVRVLHSGICHSDLTVIDNAHGLPVVLGHEAAGEIAAVGDGVRDLHVGDKVILAPLAPCGHCGACERQAGTECLEALAFVNHLRPDGTSPFSRGGELVHRGLGVGGFAEYTIVPASGAARVPDDTPLDIACVIGCAVQTGVGAVLNTAAVRPGSSVVVLGAGGVGQAVVQGARIAGAEHIIVSEPVAERRATARAMGATAVIDPTVDDLRAAVMDLTGGAGADYAFEAAGSGALVQVGIELTGVGGTVVVVGAPPHTHTGPNHAAGRFITMGKPIGSSHQGG
ncbi:MAG: alcohol dehydrogenase catalytic domain-containing protein, partial [Actinomycetota bacterium]